MRFPAGVRSPRGAEEKGIGSEILFMLVLALLATSFLPRAASAHGEGGEEENWLVSHYVSGVISATPDPGAAQWEGAKMLVIGDPPANLMSINNGTYFVIFVQTDFSGSLEHSIVALKIAQVGANDTIERWSWTQNQFFGSDDVSSVGELSDGTLSVVFGAPTSSDISGRHLSVGTPYPDSIKVATSGNTSEPGSGDFSHSAPIGFELIPYMDHYPKIPLLYSATILVAGVGFLFLENRKYGRSRA